MNKKVLITGGSRGIGFETVKLLLEKGYEVTSISRNKNELEILKNVKHLAIDLSCSESFEILDNIPDIDNFDILINNVGGGAHSKIQKISKKKLLETINLNLNISIYLTHLVSKGMIKRKNGLIINIASIHAINGDPGSSLYSAAKAGIKGFSDALFYELKHHKIRVTAVYPDFVDTKLIPASTKERSKMLKPYDVASVIVYLADLPENIVIKDLVLSSNR